MKDEPLPSQHHISRYCAKKTLSEDGNLTYASFLLRKERDEKYLSVNWLEYFDGDNIPQRLDCVRQELTDKGVTLRESAKFAVLLVEEVIRHVHANSIDKRILSILHWPSHKDAEESHSAIRNTAIDEDVIAHLIAETVREVYPAKAPKS